MSETPGGTALLPLSTTELIKRTVQIYGSNLQWFLVTAAAVLIPLTIIQLVVHALISGGLGEEVVQRTTEDTVQIEVFTLTSPTFLLTLLTFFIQQVFLNGIITFMASEAVLGRTSTALSAIQHIHDRFAPLAAAMIVVFAIVFSAIVLLTFVFFLCGLGVGIIFYLSVTLFTLLVPVMILERVSVGDGIQRTWSLSKRRFWPLLGLLIVLALLTFLISIVFELADLLVDSGNGDEGVNYAQVILNLAYQIVVTPIMPIALTLMYYDTRIRLEGLGLALERTASPGVRLWDLPSPKLPARLTTADVSNMMVLSLLLIVITVVVVVLLGLSVADMV